MTGAAAEVPPERLPGPRRVPRSLRIRLARSFLLAALVPLLVLAAWTLDFTSRTLDRLTRSALLDECELGSAEVGKAIAATQFDMFFLTALPSVRSLVAAGAGTRSPELVQEVAHDFAALVVSQPRYAGAALIDEFGDELVRVRRARDAVQIVPEPRLRLAGADPFFREGMRLAPGRTILSEMQLADPEHPASGAVIRILTRLFDEQTRRRGAVVVDVKLETVLDSLRLSGVASERLLLIDPRGVYLEHPRPPSGPDEAPWSLNLAEHYPYLHQALGQLGTALLEGADGSVAALKPIDLAGPQTAWYVATVRSPQAVRAPVTAAWRTALLVVLGSVLLAIASAVLVGQRLSRPLLQLARDAQALGRGELFREVRADTGDEIEILARSMNSMARELKAIHETLEQRISDKTREISQAHARLQAAYDELNETHRRLKESELELIQSEKLSGLGRLAASVAHEINNPAGIISMYAQMLREEAPDAGARDRLELIIQSAEKISHTVRALLDYSRRSPLEHAAVRLSQVILGARDDLASGGSHPGLEVVLQGELDLEVSGDPVQLGSVFRNLFENAAHAMGGAGRIQVELARRQGEVEARVDDRGPGIPADVLPRIFEPFFTTRQRRGGTGLGLFVAYGVIQNHRGSLRADNLPGGGARFTVTLPLHHAESAQP